MPTAEDLVAKADRIAGLAPDVDISGSRPMPGRRPDEIDQAVVVLHRPVSTAVRWCRLLLITQDHDEAQRVSRANTPSVVEVVGEEHSGEPETYEVLLLLGAPER